MTKPHGLSKSQIAYLEAIHPTCDTERREEIGRDLRACCALDTRAMIGLLDHLTQRPGNA